MSVGSGIGVSVGASVGSSVTDSVAVGSVVAVTLASTVIFSLIGIMSSVDDVLLPQARVIQTKTMTAIISSFLLFSMFPSNGSKANPI